MRLRKVLTNLYNLYVTFKVRVSRNRQKGLRGSLITAEESTVCFELGLRVLSGGQIRPSHFPD